MKNVNRFLLLAAFVGVMTAVMIVPCYADSQNPTYEYKVVHITGSDVQAIEQQLNTLGKDGWELVSVTMFWNAFTNKTYTLFLKRKNK